MKKSYYAIIPANIRYDERLTDGAKLLYGEITALCNQEGYCWAGDGYFVDLYKVSRSTVQRWFNQLEGLGYIKRVVTYKEGTKSIDKRYTYLCDNPIPKNETTYTQKRDNPIPKNETVNNTVNTTFNNSSSNAYQFYEENFGMINPYIAENIEHWINDLNENLVIESMKIALKSGKKFNYAEGILKDWLKNNVKTIDDVKAKQKEFDRKPNNKKSKFIEEVNF